MSSHHTTPHSSLRPWGPLVAVAMLALACGGGDETGAGGGGPSGGQGGTITTGGGGNSSGQGGAPDLHPGVLVDEELVVRYYLDEANSGQEPTEVVDAAADPLPLPLTYVNEGTDTFMTYTEDLNGNSGLAFAEWGRSDRASLAIDGTKISAMLHGGFTVTYEVVADVQGVTESTSRLLHIGVDTGHTLALETHVLTRMSFEFNDSGRSSVPSYLPDLGRAVYHAVVDSTQVEPLDRLRIYVNGGRLPIITDIHVAQEALDLGIGRHFVIGNREIGGRTIEGVIYYAAVYAAALSEEQVLQNTALLLADDDTPGG